MVIEKFQEYQEILKDLKDIDVFVASFGSGGTISGTAKYLKKYNPKIKIIAIEPQQSPLLSQGYANGHKIQGIGANFIPKIFWPHKCFIIKTSWKKFIK